MNLSGGAAAATQGERGGSSRVPVAAGSEDADLARVRIPETVVYRSFAHETVILNLDTGLYHGVNPTGGEILDALAATGRIEDAVAALVGAHDVPLVDLRRDVHAFCRALVERGLLVIDPA